MPSLDASLPRLLADLEGFGVEALYGQWRNHLGGEPPVHLPHWLFLRVLAYRLQAAASGDIDKATRRIIQGESENGAGAPFDRRDPQTRDGVGLKAGALLVREWQGKLERVTVLEEGFAWNGNPYGSLSQIAKAMTGTSWNGHRFFGLRQGREEDKARRKEDQGGNGEAAADVGQRPQRSNPSRPSCGTSNEDEEAHRAQRAPTAAEAP